MKLNVPIFVLGTVRRPGLVIPHLAEQTYTWFVNEPWPVPPGARMIPLYTCKHCPLEANYQIFTGFQRMAEMFLQTGKPVALFLDDDAVPNTPEWPEIVNAVVSNYMNVFELMYLCGRRYDLKRFDTIGLVRGRPIYQLRGDIKPDPSAFGGKQHVYGPCVSLWSRQFAERAVKMEWPGIPNDVHFPDNSKFAFMPDSASPFTHDRSQGSLVEGKKK